MPRTLFPVLVIACAFVVAGCATEVAAPTTSASATAASSTPSPSRVIGTMPPAGDGPVDEVLCEALREQAELALALGADPEEAFEARDRVFTPGFNGAWPINAMDRVPDDIQEAQDEIVEAIDDILPELDIAAMEGREPTELLAAFHATYDDTAQLVLDYASGGCVG